MPLDFSATSEITATRHRNETDTKQASSGVDSFLYHAIENTANQNTGKMYIRQFTYLVYLVYLFSHFHQSRETGCRGSRTTEQGSKLSASFCPPTTTTTEDRPQHRELHALLLTTSEWVLLRPTGVKTLKSCETGPTDSFNCCLILLSLVRAQFFTRLQF